MRFDSPASVGHAYILSSPSRETSVRAAHELAQAAVCQAEHDVPCGVCRNCRKAVSGVHPDIVTIRRLPDKNGNLKRDIGISQIREMILAAQVLPGEADRKAFIIEEAELLNLNAQNAALKLLEEPPQSAVFLLCTTNPAFLLETVRSRCQSISLASETGEQDEESGKLAASFLVAVRSGDPERLYRWVSKNELSRLDETRAFLDAALQQTADMLCRRTPAGTLNPEQQMALFRLLSGCQDYLSVNVNPKHVFSLLITESMNGVSE